uniref:Putative secreted protein n=1 Tax=Anopheles marajoara TaxID=58244 RepID=A0A2M4C7Q5_9DIPT
MPFLNGILLFICLRSTNTLPPFYLSASSNHSASTLLYWYRGIVGIIASSVVAYRVEAFLFYKLTTLPLNELSNDNLLFQHSSTHRAPLSLSYLAASFSTQEIIHFPSSDVHTN